LYSALALKARKIGKRNSKSETNEQRRLEGRLFRSKEPRRTPEKARKHGWKCGIV